MREHNFRQLERERFCEQIFHPLCREVRMSRLTTALANLALVIFSIVLVLVAMEGFLWVYAAGHTPPPPAAAAVPPPSLGSEDEILVPLEVVAAAKQRQQILSMPESWKRTPTQVSGAASAVYWHDVLHVYNSEHMRWATPFPPKRDDVFRVMVVGDSLTYGEGIAEDWRFSNLLERSMNQQYRIEFLNLGIDGTQSEDILRVIKKYLPILKPNLVFYAICINDFLPSGTGEYNNATAYPFPLPDSLKNFFIQHTRTGAFLNETYDGALRRLHLRADFVDDVLKDFDGYQRRFVRDVAEMNATVRAAGLPPLIGMVVYQYIGYGDRGYKLTKIAEAALAQAGGEVIPTEDYYRRYHGQAMNVSRWEGHPNEVANYIWAGMIARALQGRPELAQFKR
jgi:hypothetical protein